MTCVLRSSSGCSRTPFELNEPKAYSLALALASYTLLFTQFTRILSIYNLHVVAKCLLILGADLLNFIRNKLRTEGAETVIFRDNQYLTLTQVFERYSLSLFSSGRACRFT